jgi:tetratricopeptide (TPR) repeat protein
VWADPGTYLDELLEDGRYEEAAVFLGQLVAHDPTAGDVYSMRALVLRVLERHDEALQAANNGVAAAPTSSFAVWALGAVLDDLGRTRDAERAARRALELDPTNADAHALLARCLIARRKLSEAVAAAEAGLDFDPGHEPCLGLRALALRWSDAGEEFAEAVDSLLQLYPASGFARTGLGWAALDRGAADEAREHFQQALALDPTAGWARDGLIEATKASNPLYRNTLRFFLWFGRLSPRTRWGIIIGGILGYNYLYGAVEANPGLRVVAYPLMALWAAFILLSWTVEPLSDFVLGLDDEGRRLVTPERRLAARWVTGTLAAAVALGGLGLATGLERVGLSALAAGFLVIPMSGVFHCASGWPRKAMGGYTGLLGVLWLSGLLGPENWSDIASGWTILGSVLGSWVGAFLSSRTP